MDSQPRQGQLPCPHVLIEGRGSKVSEKPWNLRGSLTQRSGERHVTVLKFLEWSRKRSNSCLDAIRLLDPWRYTPKGRYCDSTAAGGGAGSDAVSLRFA